MNRVEKSIESLGTNGNKKKDRTFGFKQELETSFLVLDMV